MTGQPISVLISSSSKKQLLDLAANRTSSPDLLRQLAVHPDKDVRHGVATNQSSPEDILRQLASDKDGYVRSGVAENTATSPWLLAQLAKQLAGKAECLNNCKIPPQLIPSRRI